jgi:hypothetical protein
MPSTGTTAARGYGKEHEHQRRAWAPKVRRGEAYCTRCKQPIAPDDAWDLGHNDDRTAWTGPEHATCNRRAGQAASVAARKGLMHSRAW